jgi:hypothetical protein
MSALRVNSGTDPQASGTAGNRREAAAPITLDCGIILRGEPDRVTWGVNATGCGVAMLPLEGHGLQGKPLRQGYQAEQAQ